MYERHGINGQAYSTADIRNTINEIAGRDLSALLDTYVLEDNTLDIEPYLEQLGLGLTAFAEEMYICVEQKGLSECFVPQGFYKK